MSRIKLGPYLNHQKSEMICTNPSTADPICLQSLAPRCWTQQVPPCSHPLFLLWMLPLSLLASTIRFTALPPCAKDLGTSQCRMTSSEKIVHHSQAAIKSSPCLLSPSVQNYVYIPQIHRIDCTTWNQAKPSV